MASTEERGTAPGPGVDASGRPVVDPSKNVDALVEAAIQRQDDLRETESRHIRELMALRERYNDKLIAAESQRIDAIRAVDVGAVQEAARAAETRANTLASTVAQSAEALRIQAQQQEVQFRQLLETTIKPLTEAVAQLRQSQYELQGAKIQTAESRDVTRDEKSVQQFSISTVIAIIAAGAAIIFAFMRSQDSPAATEPVVVTVPVPATPTTTP